jgi:hypothetical protein
MRLTWPEILMMLMGAASLGLFFSTLQLLNSVQRSVAEYKQIVRDAIARFDSIARKPPEPTTEAPVSMRIQ